MAAYNTKVKMALVDVKEISCDTPNNFNDAKVEAFAKTILDVGCLLKPLILNQTGARSFKVVDGAFEYYAAVRANAIDTQRELGGMVNSFICKDDGASFALEQRQPVTAKLSKEEKALLISKLAAELAAECSVL